MLIQIPNKITNEKVIVDEEIVENRHWRVGAPLHS